MIAPACAIASMVTAPGMTGAPGKCPSKKGSLIETFFKATSRRSPSTSITRSTRRNGYRCGRILRISAMRSSIQDYGLGTAGGGAFGAGAPAGAAALGAVILGSFWYAAFIIRMTSFVISEDLAAKIILVSCVD